MALSWRDRLAANLGVTPARKQEFYCGLIESVTLTDIIYWLQVVFAAGIATLGLVLDSPAVIIGAMLISPLMGPILANGMAFAAGDLVLALRAIASLTLSCMVAIGFAMVLIAVMPFREQTGEILARTQPNALDLVIALFSGALGSLAITREPKGVVTSIPGVAIAVALMPPLCVVGYGLGLQLSINPTDGWSIARGGALLFLTNLTAITFTAMVVFLLLHIATPEIKQEVKDFHLRDSQSRWILSILRRLPESNRLRMVGSLPSRLLAILLPILILLGPLQASLKRLQREILTQQQSNQVLQVATEIWQESFAKYEDGQPRAFLSQLTPPQFNQDQLVIQMTIFTSKAYSLDERKDFTRLVAARLNRPAESVSLQLIEIPTTTNQLLQREQQEPEPEPLVPDLPTVAESQQQLLGNVDSALNGFDLPPSASLLGYEISTSPAQPLLLRFAYLSDRPIGPDALALMTEEVLQRLQFPQAEVQFDRIPVQGGRLTFPLDSSELEEAADATLNRLGAILQRYPQLQLICVVNRETEEAEALSFQRYSVVSDRLVNRSPIAANRLSFQAGATLPRNQQPTVEFSFQMRPQGNSPVAPQP